MRSAEAGVTRFCLSDFTIGSSAQPPDCPPVAEVPFCAPRPHVFASMAQKICKVAVQLKRRECPYRIHVY